MRLRPLLSCLLLTAGLSRAGEIFRFEATVGPGGRAGSVHGYAFDAVHERLAVIDRDVSGAEKWPSLGDGFVAKGAVAGCNAGYTRPDGRPEGIVVSGSKPLGKIDPANALANGLLVVKENTIRIVKAASGEGELSGASEALQAGPLLVENGVPLPGLNTKVYARHSVLVGSGTGEWAILYVPSATMDGLAAMLADGTRFTRFKVTVALNLGNGLSTALWLAQPENALPLYLREVDPVRSGLAIVAK